MMKITLEFEDSVAAEDFVDWWLDGGGQQEAGFNTIECSWEMEYMRLKRCSDDEDDCNQGE